MAGIAAAEAVEEVTGVRPDLRWPNDLLLSRAAYRVEGCAAEERKFCGILTELNAEVTRVRFAVVGIGVNVNQESFPRDLADTATSLRIETGKTWSRVELAAALLKSLDREYQRMAGPALPISPQAGGMEASPRDALFRRFEQASSYARGRRVHVDEDGGYTGVTQGLDERGFLLVRTDQGTLRRVLSGGVRGIG
jgi:BirA family biotin operon repressor/biotin-[acetyl-CoA-carboxylase] ligase